MNEPENRYAAVVDTAGCEWLRDRLGTWSWLEYQGLRLILHTRSWEDLDVAQVLSEGVLR